MLLVPNHSPPLLGDACAPHNFAQTSMLLHLNGADGSDAIVDGSQYGHAATVIAPGQIDTDRSVFDGAAYLSDGGNAQVQFASHASLSLGTGDFSIDCWIYPLTHSGETVMSTGNYYTSTDGEWAFRTQADVSKSRINFTWEDSVGGLTGLNSAVDAVDINEWTWVGVRRVSNVLSLWVNGEQSGSTKAITQSLTPSGHGVIFGGNSSSSNNGFNGSLDEFRLVKGSAEDLSVIPTARYCDS